MTVKRSKKKQRLVVLIRRLQHETPQARNIGVVCTKKFRSQLDHDRVRGGYTTRPENASLTTNFRSLTTL